MAIKCILLDLDDTIYDFHKSERIALGETLSSFGIEPTEAVTQRYSEINKDCWRMLEQGIMTREQILVERFRRLFEEFSVECDAQAVRMSYERNLSEYAFFIDGALEMIDSLRGKYVLAIASNGTARVQDRRIEKGNIAHLFNHIFISERVGATKPSVEFFDKCFVAMGNPSKDEVIILGDSLTSDIAGGIAAGIHTCYFDKNAVGVSGNVLPEYSITKLSEFNQVIESINNK